MLGSGSRQWVMAAERLEVVADFVELCSYCGAACTGTILVWFRDGDVRVAFETDSGSLSVPLGELVDAAIEQSEYNALPIFVQDWNEGRGWAECGSDGAAVSADDLLQTVDILDKRRAAADVRGGVMLAGLRAFVAKAACDGHEVWVAET